MRESDSFHSFFASVLPARVDSALRVRSLFADGLAARPARGSNMAEETVEAPAAVRSAG